MRLTNNVRVMPKLKKSGAKHLRLHGVYRNNLTLYVRMYTRIMCVYVYIYIYTHTHTHTHTHILIRSNKMQQIQVFITANLLYMFRASIDPIIRSTSNITTVSGTGHCIRATTFCQRGLITLAEVRCPDT